MTMVKNEQPEWVRKFEKYFISLKLPMACYYSRPPSLTFPVDDIKDFINYLFKELIDEIPSKSGIYTGSELNEFKFQLSKKYLL